MRIILEGPDGLGKSSLSKELSRDLHKLVFWSAGPPGTFDAVRKCCEDQFNMKNKIFDRVTCISERCYNMNISTRHKKLLHKFRNATIKNSIVIYCTALVPEADDGLRNKEHDKMVRDNFEEIKRRYKNLMSIIPHIKYNFQTTKYEDLLCLIERNI